VGAVGGNGGFWRPGDVDVGEQETNQDRDLDGTGWARAIQEALEDETLESGLAQRDDGVAIAGMVHAKSGVGQRRYQVLGQPSGVLQLLKN
jgi:hypothetical protein